MEWKNTETGGEKNRKSVWDIKQKGEKKPQAYKSHNINMIDIFTEREDWNEEWIGIGMKTCLISKHGNINLKSLALLVDGVGNSDALLYFIPRPGISQWVTQT